ncbi:MAG: hypothetical protein IJM24_08945 [Clostridia bacterium]|nr:hypothetical protein [Clostridia bacterium]MBR7062364.1 hypothetical protein [Clostridia bacterium]
MERKHVIKRICVFAFVLILMGGGIFLLSSLKSGAANVTTYSYNSDNPFFNYYMDNVYQLDNDTSIDMWFDQLPVSENTSNFSSLGTTSFANINGKTVTVDAFNRDQGDSIDDPNFAQGILIYQCIQYKVQHPDEEVYLYFSSYRTSVTASVCIDRNSRYFGYMRSLHDCEYDNHGFVRISFMLVEAARMGIHVTLVTQLDSYGVNQYSETAAKHYAYKANLSHVTYFSNALRKNCYTSYAAGKKVSDYMTFTHVGWDVDARGGDMHHIKTCIASNYIDKDGVEHGPTVFLTSSNLDENDYLGRNGNTGSQSGAVISDHAELFNVIKNYLDLITQYKGVDDMPRFRDLVRMRQTEQMDLIREGLGDTIPENERLVYLGSETDDVFEMCFTPLPGGVMVWDTVHNPYAKYLSEMAASTGPIVFTWNMPYNSCSNFFEYTFEDIICEAFHRNRNPQNRIYMHFESFEASRYNDLTVGKDIGFKSVNKNLSMYLHSKDIIMSYEKDGARKYISIVSSANFGVAAFWQRTNSVLVIKETEEQHEFYTTLGRATTFGAIE